MGWTLNQKPLETLGLEKVTRWVAATGAATKQLTNKDRIVFASGASIAGTVYLPPVNECVGLWFVIVATSVATGTIAVYPFQGGQSTPDSTIYECESSSLGGGTATYETISAANGWVMLMSVGDRWIVVADDLDAA